MRRRNLPGVALFASILGLVAGISAPVPSAASPAPAPSAPAHVVELAASGTVELLWSQASGDVGGYQVAPVRDGVPCTSCAEANLLPPGDASVVLAQSSGVLETYAVRAAGPGGDSTWQLATASSGTLATAVPPAEGGSRSSAVVPAITDAPGGAWAAEPVTSSYTSPLDQAPPGYVRVVSRDDGFSAPSASDGDLWVFADTDTFDTPTGDTFGPDTVGCFTGDGTAAVAPPLGNVPKAGVCSARG